MTYQKGDNWSDSEHCEPASIGELINSAVDIKEGSSTVLVPRLLETVRNNLGMEVGFISRFSEGRREFLYVSSDDSHDAPEIGSSDPIEESACLRMVRGQAPNLVRDAKKDPALRDLSVIGKLGVRSYASVPIPSGTNDCFGTLCCYSCAYKEDLDERDIGFMSAIADLIGTVMQEEQRTADDLSTRRAYIRDVIKSQGLQMVWQPIVDTKTGELTSIESLARFQTEPYRPPNEWFEEAARLGISSEVERTAILRGMAIKAHLPKNMYVACNISGNTFLEPAFQNFLGKQDLRQVVLEITEHDIIADYKKLACQMAEFRKQGLSLAIDDFGAGFASFRHIVELHPDIIKLDMSLVRNIDSTPSIQSVVRALIYFAEERAISLVAEGVETEAEFTMLRSLGIKRVQGYFCHKPMPQSNIVDLYSEEGLIGSPRVLT